MLVAKQFAGAAHTGLDFVDDEKQVLAVAQVAQTRQVVLARHHDTALALNSLDHYRDRLIVDGALERGDVVIRHEPEPGHQRQEALMVLFLAGRAQSADSAAVEGAERGENFEPAALAMAPSARELNRRLDGLRTRVAEEE